MNGLLDTLLKNADLLLPDGSVRRDAEVGIRGGAIVSIADRGQSGGAGRRDRLRRQSAHARLL